MTMRHRLAVLAAALVLPAALAACSGASPTSANGATSSASSASTGRSVSPSASSTATATDSASGVHVYAHTGRNQLTGAAVGAKPQIYVPDTLSNRVDVIDPATYRVIRSFPVGREPQHVVPSWDLKTLWVNDDKGNDLVPINARTGKVGRAVPVADPYNLYFTPDGKHALVMAERLRRIDVRDPHTMKLQRSMPVPCYGVNHADYTADGSVMIASCEFSGKVLVIPTTFTKVARVIDLNKTKTRGATDPMKARHMGGPMAGIRPGASSMPQDVRLTDDGSTFLVADMMRNGVWKIDAKTLRLSGFLHTGKGAHGIYPSRDAKRIFVSNRDAGSVSVLDATGDRVLKTWPLSKGASPDMGGVTADGSQLWLAGRYDSEVYVIDTTSGKLLHRIKVGNGPHGLAVWPQPGRFSLGHTGNMR
ncbi:MAG: YncE family protein [Angustibacter sp.]